MVKLISDFVVGDEVDIVGYEPLVVVDLPVVSEDNVCLRCQTTDGKSHIVVGFSDTLL